MLFTNVLLTQNKFYKFIGVIISISGTGKCCYAICSQRKIPDTESYPYPVFLKRVIPLAGIGLILERYHSACFAAISLYLDSVTGF